MKKIGKKVVLVLMLVCMLMISGFIPMVSTGFSENTENVPENNNVSNSSNEIQAPISRPMTLTNHTPIRINNDTEFNIGNGVTSGNGSINNPYVIDNWIINGSGYGICIYIGNTTKHFTIRNCTIHNADGKPSSYFYNNTGILLHNIANGTIFNNTVLNNTGNGIHLRFSNDCNLSENDAFFNNDSGIFVENCHYNLIYNNTISENNKGKNHAGFYLIHSENNTLIMNHISNNPNYGLFLQNSHFNNFFRNQIVFNCGGYSGVFLISSNSNEFHNNFILNGTGVGIQFYDSHHNNFENNIINGNANWGLYLAFSKYNYFGYNDFNQNSNGIRCLYSKNNIFRHCTIAGNTFDGIVIEGYNSINCSDNIFSDNVIAKNNRYGIYFYDGYAHINNQFNSNLILDNTNYGIRVGSRSNNNMIYHNVFLNNNNGGIQGYDDNGNNYWDDGRRIGNYWSHYLDHYPGASNDGKVWNTPYDLAGGAAAQDQYPIAYLTRRPIRINGNSNFTIENGVVSGNGTKNNPYLIEGWKIDGGGIGNCIFIGNTTANFTIRNCYLHNATNNLAPYYWDTGLVLFNCINGLVERTISSSSNFIGALLFTNTDNNVIENCQFQNNGYGMYLLSADGNSINNSKVDGNSQYGIYISSSNNNNITNTTLLNNGQQGVHLTGGSINNQVHHNNFIDNNGGNIQGFDTNSNNDWDDGIGEGNFWKDYQKRYPTATNNHLYWSPPYDIPTVVGHNDSYPLYKGVGLKYSPRPIPIRINGDGNFTNESGVVRGDGSAADPYIIEGWEIDATGFGCGIYIGNTTAHFKIQNCYIHNASGNSNPYYMNSNILLFSNQYGDVENCLVENANWYGINCYQGSIFTNVFANNTIRYNNWDGMNLYIGRNKIVTNNTFYGIPDHRHAIIMRGINNDINNNTMTNTGIALVTTYNTHSIEDNTVNGKPIYYYKDTSGFVVPSDVGQLILGNCYDTEISGLNISNSSFGILIGDCTNITVDNCVLENNRDSGIRLAGSSKCNITNSEFYGTNRRFEGIQVYFGSTDNLVENNIFKYLNLGINFQQSTNNDFMENLFDSNQIGIFLQNADFNDVINNTFQNSNTYGVFIISGADNNSIHHNNFLNNNGGGVQAFDSVGENFWNDSAGEGNYWDDYLVRYPLAIRNGMVWSIPYGMLGAANAFDYFPLVLRVGGGISVYKSIRIDNNSGFNLSNGVSSGSGTINDPYIIENWEIDGNGYGYCIYVGNTTNHFIIRNCTAQYSKGNSGTFYWDSGIILNNLTFGTIFNCTVFTNTGTGIYLLDSFNCSIENSQNITWNYDSGIYLEDSELITIFNNNISWNNQNKDWNYGGIILNKANFTFIELNYISNNPRYGIRIDQSLGNQIYDNQIVFNCGGESGLYMDQSLFHIVIGNNISNNTGDGIEMYDSSYNTFANNKINGNNKGTTGNGGVRSGNGDYNYWVNNTFIENTDSGMFMTSCDYNEFWANHIINNTNYGIYISNGEGNNFTANNISENQNIGIHMNSCDGNNITANNITENQDYGIFFNSCDDNNITENYINENQDYGIRFDHSDGSNITLNTISKNNNGGLLLDGIGGSSRNIVANNTIFNNSGYGIYLSSIGPCQNNSIIRNDIILNDDYGVITANFNGVSYIHHNNFYLNNNNGIQGNDTYGNNFWNDNNGEGNWWSDYEARYVPPAKSDGRVWDTPYVVDGGTGVNDSFPLAYPIEYNSPEITDFTPNTGTTGDGFTFDCNVTDDMNVSQVRVKYWYGDDTAGAVNVTCDYNENTDRWELDITLKDDDLGPLRYIISAEDPSHNWKATNIDNIIISDNDKPDANAGADLNINMSQIVIFNGTNSIDNIEISNYTWTFNYNGDDVVLYNVTPEFQFDIAGNYNVTLRILDTSSNNDTDSIWVNVFDIKSPWITNLSYPSTVDVNEEIEITVTVIDPSGLNAVRLVYNDVENVEHNISMTHQTGNNWAYTITGQSTFGDVTFSIWVNDTFGNWNKTVIHTVKVLDRLPPKISNLKFAEKLDVGSNIKITVEVEDESGISAVYLNYTDVYDVSYNVTMNSTARGTNFTYTIPAQDKPGTVEFFIWAMDMNDNWDKTEVNNIEITKAGLVTQLVITWIELPTEVEVDDPITIKVKVVDDDGVKSVYLNYTDVDNTINNKSMTSIGNNEFTLTIPAQNKEGTVKLFVSAVNNNDIKNRTIIKTINVVKDNTPPKVEKTYPEPNEKDVPTDTDIVIIFSEPMKIAGFIDLVTIDPGINFHLSWKENNSNLSIILDEKLKHNETYEITISDKAADLESNQLGEAYKFKFTTEISTFVDTDGDKIPDDWEIEHGLDPTDSEDANFDPDDDKLSNYEEYLAGTNLTNWDSDFDGIDDGWEVKYELNPNNAADALEDADGDKYSNLDEYKGNSDPTNAEDVPKEEEKKEDDYMTLLLAIILVIIIIIILLAILMKRSRGEKEAEVLEEEGEEELEEEELEEELGEEEELEELEEAEEEELEELDELGEDELDEIDEEEIEELDEDELVEFDEDELEETDEEELEEE